jgi:hypothetical protein
LLPTISSWSDGEVEVLDLDLLTRRMRGYAVPSQTSAFSKSIERLAGQDRDTGRSLHHPLEVFLGICLLLARDAAAPLGVPGALRVSVVACDSPI